MAKEPYVDQDVCISCGLCVTNVPAVFDWDDNGKANAMTPKVPARRRSRMAQSMSARFRA